MIELKFRIDTNFYGNNLTIAKLTKVIQKNPNKEYFLT